MVHRGATPRAPANMLVFTTSTGVVAVVVARPVSMLAHRCVAGPSAMPDAAIHQRLVPSYTAHCTDVSTAARACTGPGHVNAPPLECRYHQGLPPGSCMFPGHPCVCRRLLCWSCSLTLRSMRGCWQSLVERS